MAFINLLLVSRAGLEFVITYLVSGPLSHARETNREIATAYVSISLKFAITYVRSSSHIQNSM